MPKQSQGRFFYRTSSDATAVYTSRAEELVGMLADGLDHPELWPTLAPATAEDPQILSDLHCMLSDEAADLLAVRILLALSEVAPIDVAAALDWLSPLAIEHDQSPLLQGALFYLHGLLNPGDPKFSLKGKICRDPFSQLTIAEGRSFLCCPSWLPTSIGDPYRDNAEDMWNSLSARAIRESIHDGSFRYCNKIVCPLIQENILPTRTKASLTSNKWQDIILHKRVELSTGPEVVNLCYDRTCNLSCPSCRAESFAADAGLRGIFTVMQERLILPLLKTAKLVIVTGSGDPFASKNFRQLMHDLTPDEYPELRFRLMTNGMLLTPQQWDMFPSLHRRVEMLKISVDAAEGNTHEKLRRGAKWKVMLENMKFAGQLAASGMVDQFEISFVVQAGNYREMGNFVDLARYVGATRVYFARVMNWELFSDEEYREMAVFLPGHPDHEDFLRHMQDPRLRDSTVWLGNLQEFVGSRQSISA